jgi:hypothetical protein
MRFAIIFIKIVFSGNTVMKSWTLALAFGTVVTTTAIGLGVKPASAASLIGDFVFSVDQEFTANGVISGTGPVISETKAFSKKGDWWTIDGTVTTVRGTLQDSVGVSATIFHNKPTSDGGENGAGTSFTDSLSASAFDSSSGVFNKSVSSIPSVSHGKHFDKYIFRLSGTTKGLSFRDIETWTFSITGNHSCNESNLRVPRSSFVASVVNIIESAFILPAYAQTFPDVGVCTVPEPSSNLGILVIGGWGILGAASTLKRKLKSSKSSEKDNTKTS